MIKIHTCDPGYIHKDFYFRDCKEAIEWLKSCDWRFLDKKTNFGCYVQMEPIYFYYSEEKKDDSRVKDKSK